MRFVKRDAIFFHFPAGSINGGVFRYSDSWSHSNCYTYLLHFSISFFILLFWWVIWEFGVLN